MRLTNPKTYYDMRLPGHLQIGGRPLRLPRYRRAIVDSGSTLVVLTTAAFRTLVRHLQTHHCDVPHLCDANTWFRGGHCAHLRDADRRKLPTLVFQLEGFNVTLEAGDYMIRNRSNGTDYWCVGIMGLDSLSGGVDAIFGNTVIKKYVTVYDREKERVGFALSGGNCERKIRTEPDGLPVKNPDMKREGAGPAVDHKHAQAGDSGFSEAKTDICDSAQSCTDCEKLGGN